MLQLHVPSYEDYDEDSGEKIVYQARELKLEHSLVSLSKWECIWKKPFLDRQRKTPEETISYIKCMSLTPITETEIRRMPADIFTKITDYIEDPMTACKINDHSKGSSHSSEYITSETIYYQMTALSIPMECQYWHLNRLLALLNFVRIKNEPPKKMSQHEIYEQNNRLNKLRREKLKTKG